MFGTWIRLTRQYFFNKHMFTNIILVGLVSAAKCTKDILIDEFKKIKVDYYDNTLRNFNLIGGDYGHVGIESTYREDDQNLSLASTKSSNFWFSKFNREACFDLRGYKSIEFDIIAPKGCDAQFTLAQRSSDCQKRLVDSSYTKLTDYLYYSKWQKTKGYYVIEGFRKEY
jgi:hypothetical protein